MLEEFGKFASGREALFRRVYTAAETNAKAGGPLKGAAFWQWYDIGQVSLQSAMTAWFRRHAVSRMDLS